MFLSVDQLTSQWRSRRIGQVYISREDQQMNLKILQEALTENQISEQLCLGEMRRCRVVNHFPIVKTLQVADTARTQNKRRRFGINLACF